MFYTKLCPRCGRNLGINYWIRSDTDDGRPLHSICKDCRESILKKVPAVVEKHVVYMS